ncbi:MAG: TetR family transcriptional regulator [Solirubrobacterales bacterium]|nr:TetR family transcriptional regulator [Solirubrobacterales bacterium]
MTPATATRTLSTAEQRRAELLEAAVPVFAERGYHAAPTMAIAKAAGISQAYLFRLFPTKAELFAAVTGIASERMLATFREAAARARAAGADPLEAMGQAYGDLLERDRDVLLVQLHSQVAAGAEPLIREAMRRCFRDLYELVARESGAGSQDLQAWFAHGMLCNVMAAIGADALDETWARALTGEEGETE